MRIRRGMDVYSVYQNQYLGTVVNVWSGAAGELSPVERGATPPQTQSGGHAAEAGSTAHVEEDTAQPTQGVEVNRLLGEDLGPFPTRVVGNTGPKHQAAEQFYATAPRSAQPGVVYFAVRMIRPGSINPFVPKLYIPTSAIMSISMERIVVDVQKDQIPAAWHQEPLT